MPGHRPSLKQPISAVKRLPGALPAARRLRAGLGRARSQLRLRRVQGSRVPVGAAVTWHRIGDPPGDPARELVPAVASRVFRAQVEYLARTYEVVPAGDLHEAALRRARRGRVPLALTFDDDLASHAEVAAPELERAGVPGTFFLTGASLRGPLAFWWELLQAAHDGGRFDADVAAAAGVDARSSVHQAAAAIQALEPGRREAVETLLRERAPGAGDSGLREANVRRLARAGHEVGFHTLRHLDVTTLDGPALEAAVTEGRAALEAAAGGPLMALAYPHGRADAPAAAAARAAGYRVAFTTEPEVVGLAGDPLRRGRFDAPYDAVRPLALTLSAALDAHARASGDAPRAPAAGHPDSAAEPKERP